MSSAPEPSNKVIRLRPRPTPTQRWAMQTADDVRWHLSLLQGYADLMEGMSPQQSVQILQVMAEKIGEMTMALRPFMQQDIAARNIDDYRQTRMRSRQLLSEYRGLLDRLTDTLSQARDVAAGRAAKPRVS